MKEASNTNDRLQCNVRDRLSLNSAIHYKSGSGYFLYYWQVGEVTQVIQSSRVYVLGPTRTNKTFIINTNSTRPMRLEYVSNQPITEEEYTIYRKYMFDHHITGAPGLCCLCL